MLHINTCVYTCFYMCKYIHTYIRFKNNNVTFTLRINTKKMQVIVFFAR